MAHSVVTSKGQITIPKSVRNKLNLKTGDKVDFKISGKDVILVPVSKSVEEVFGILSGKSTRKISIDEMNQLIKKRAAEKNK
jgi:AbrB family looped-hinge helix DNA binding protein